MSESFRPAYGFRYPTPHSPKDMALRATSYFPLILKVMSYPGSRAAVKTEFMLNQISPIEHFSKANGIEDIWGCLDFLFMPTLDNFFEVRLLAFSAHKVIEVWRFVGKHPCISHIRRTVRLLITNKAKQTLKRSGSRKLLTPQVSSSNIQELGIQSSDAWSVL